MSAHRTRVAAGILAGAASVLSAGAAGPAGASPLVGDGVAATDLGLDLALSGHTMCSGCGVSQGGMVTAWQRYLYADGYLNSCGSTGVDGYYGGVTAFANGGWEAEHLGGSDGTTTDANWGWVGARTRPVPGGKWRYSGEDWPVYLSGSGGSGSPFKMDLGLGGAHPTDHPSRGTYPYC